MARPQRVVVIAGTGTEVGKTFVGARIAEELLKQGRSVAARKPAQSFEPGDTSTDAVILGAATGENPEAVCRSERWYPVPMAPPMAATALGRERFSTEDLTAEVSDSWPEAPVDVGLVETAGGAWSPQASDGRHVGDFADSLGADGALLVADAGLGVINAVRGAVAALGSARPVVVMLNRFEPDFDLHVANRAWLVEEDGLTVVTDVGAAATALVGL